MGTVWVDSVRRSLDEAVDLLGAVVAECPDDRWDASMWRVDPSDIVGEEARVQRWSTPWSVAWHTLEVLDYDLTAELDAWAPPPPFAGHPHWRDFASIPAWSPTDILGYVDHCRRRVRDTFHAMSEERAATPLPAAHRYAGQPYARLVTSLIGHTTAHATQIRQFSAR